MLKDPKITFHGWSGFSVEAGDVKVVFDPFFRPYCDADFCKIEDFDGADVVCVTHGHQDHCLDVAPVVKRTNAKAVASRMICNHLHNHGNVLEENLVDIEPYKTVKVAGIEITAFLWRHRDISIHQGLTGGGPVMGFQWAYTALFRAPSFAPFMGFYVSIPGYKTILNYGEGCNLRLVVDEVAEIGRRFKPDIVLAAAQVFFERPVSEGMAALNPGTVIMHHPHKKLYEKINVESATPEAFIAAVKGKLLDAEVYYAQPGFTWPATTVDRPSAVAA